MKFLIFGLGNIGPDYANTRHNAGFMVLDRMASASKAEWISKRYAWRSEVKFRGRTYVLLKPTTYMNLSGKAVRYWLEKEKVSIEKSLIVLDDIALPLGVSRMRAKGSDGGHNGLIDIIEQLGTTVFPRLRIGIGDDFHKGYQVDFVLGKWSKEDMDILDPVIDKAVEMIKAFGTIGINRAMTSYNS